MKKCCPYKKLVKQARNLADQGKEFVIEGAQDLQEKVASDLMPTVENAVDSMKDQFQDAKKYSEKSFKEASKQLKKHSANGREALAEKVGKSSPKRGRKAFVFLILAALAGGIGYLLYRRSQPVDDPWAEEYWEDVEVSQFDPKEAVEDAQDKAKEVAEDVSDKAQDAVDAVKDKVEK